MTTSQSLSIKAENLALKRCNRIIFTGVSCGVSNTSPLCIVQGQNGSGKSTLLKCLGGLLEPTQGQIKRNHETNSLFFLGHRPAVKRSLTPVENLTFSPYLAQYPSQQASLEALAELGLSKHRNQLCARLSAGQLRRVALAQLLLTDRKIWLLDEPLTALDQQGIGWFKDCLDKHLHSGGLAMFTSHQPLNGFAVPHTTLNLCQEGTYEL